MASSIPLKISLRSILNFCHSVNIDWERTGRWPIFNNDQFTLLYEFDTLQIIYSIKWQHLYWVRYKILNNIKLSPSQLCLSRISVLGIDTPYILYICWTHQLLWRKRFQDTEYHTETPRNWWGFLFCPFF